MNMGTIASPWRYDVVAAHAIRPDNLRRTAILRYVAYRFADRDFTSEHRASSG